MGHCRNWEILLSYRIMEGCVAVCMYYEMYEVRNNKQRIIKDLEWINFPCLKWLALSNSTIQSIESLCRIKAPLL